jgi:hypothetical protein
MRPSLILTALLLGSAVADSNPTSAAANRGGTNEATVANPSSVSTDHGCGAAAPAP